MSNRIALISPYHGGSHEYWANGLKNHSSHKIKIFALPARFWKWRMHGGAVTLANKFLRNSGDFDIILATDMLDLATFLSLTRVKTYSMPTTLYMHENQLTYPLPENPTIGPMRRQLGERDLHYAFINFTSMLVANRIMFNSRYHQDDFLGAMPRFLGGFPEYRELKTLEEISKKSIVFPIGIEFPEPYPVSPIESESKCPLIIWNQRWEYDKNPEEFFNALYKLAERNIPFELALCGQNFRNAPQEFDLARENLADRVVHYGYASEMQYQQLLKQADVTVSTAYHEFFGISVIEAMAFGTFPILPNKLSYPEILPTEFHGSCFYSNQNELLEKLEWALLNIKTIKKIGLSISHSMRSYHWSNLITQFDDLIEGVVDNH